MEPGEPWNIEQAAKQSDDSKSNGKAGVPPTALRVPATESPRWSVKQIEQILISATAVADNMAGDAIAGPNMIDGNRLELTEREARDIARPLCQILNRRPALAALVEHSDVVALAMAMVRPASRVYRERAANIFLAAQAVEQDPVPSAPTAHSDRLHTSDAPLTPSPAPGISIDFGQGDAA